MNMSIKDEQTKFYALSFLNKFTDIFLDFYPFSCGKLLQPCQPNDIYKLWFSFFITYALIRQMVELRSINGTREYSFYTG